MGSVISKASLASFKEHTKENAEVIRILGELRNHLDDNVLDVGAGAGDIAFAALLDRGVTLLDRLDFSGSPLRPNHTRLQADFFKVYRQFRNFGGTVIFSHVFQYLDDAYEELVEATKCINPRTIVTVTNDNNGFMGNLVEWSRDQISGANPEIVLVEFPQCLGYQEVERSHFSASVAAPDWAGLSELAAYLIEAPKKADSSKIETFLRQNLVEPTFDIEQSVRVYKRESNE